MKRTFIIVHRTLWITLATILVLIAIVFSLARIFTPYLLAQRPAMEQRISSFLQQPVQINNFNIRWQWLMPVIKGTQVVIFDDKKQYPLLKADEVDIGINLLESLFTGRVQLGSFTVSGATFNVRQNQDGHINIDGLGSVLNQHAQQQPDNINEFLNFLLAAPRFSFKNITLNWYTKDGKTFPFKNLDLNLNNHWLDHTLSGSATLAQTTPTEVNIAMQMSGNLQSANTMQVNFYVNTKDLLLDQWLMQYPIAGFTAQKGIADMQLWGVLKQGQLIKLQSLFNVKQAELLKSDITSSATTPAQPLLIDHAQGNIFWKRQNGDWNFSGQFSDLNFTRWNKIPGATHLNVYLNLTKNNGFAQLIGNNTQIDFGPLFRAPLLLQSMDGAVAWQHTTEGWFIKTDQTQVKTSDATVNSTMSLLLPTDKSSPIINLVADIALQGSQHISDYLPRTILPPALIKWLDTAITNFKTTQSTLVLRGPLSNFPFDQREGVFIVDSDVQDANIKYLPNWPAVKQLSGHLVFADRSMAFNANTAQILAIPLSQLQAQIPLMKKQTPAILQIQSQMAGSASDVAQFIQQSPLQEKFSALKNVQADGNVQLQLNLTVPLEHNDKQNIKTQGQLDLQNVNLKFPAYNVAFTDLTGNLQFAPMQAYAKDITGMLWNKPVTINVTTPQQTPVIEVRYADLTTTLQQINNGWQLSLQSPALQGQALISNNKQQPIQINLQRLYISPGTTQTINNINPTSLPSLILNANDVRYGNMQFGKVQLQLTPMAEGVQITALQASSPTYNLSATGTWMGRDTAQQTSVTGSLTSNNLGGFLQSLGFSPSIIAQQAAANFGLVWPGPAYDPHFKDMAGKVSIRMQQGQIVNIDSATAMKMDIGRLLSLLSFQSIERRLKLDFSDLTSRGFSFNNLQADFQIQSGNAYLQNAAKITAPVADIEILGRIGLATEDYDLMVSVTPQLTSALPIIVGLATGPIGPVAAVATWAATQVVGTAVNKIATDNYRMTGSWSNPNVIRNK